MKRKSKHFQDEEGRETSAPMTAQRHKDCLWLIRESKRLEKRRARLMVEIEKAQRELQLTATKIGIRLEGLLGQLSKLDRMRAGADVARHDLYLTGMLPK
jgi:hypothetical protein